MILCIFLFRISGTRRDCARSIIIKIAKKKFEKKILKIECKRYHFAIQKKMKSLKITF